MLDPDFFPTAVYRLFDTHGALLYVGMGDARTRITSHLRKQAWRGEVDGARTTVEWFQTRAEADAAESAAIQADNPRYNIAKRTPKRASAPGAGRAQVDLTKLKPFTSRHLVGSKEIRERLGVGHNRVQQLINAPEWPAPFDEVAAGRIWRKEDIEAWIAEFRPALILAP